jgi:L-amino acid N-acyltransferase
MITIRTATTGDLPAILDIYNEAVAKTTATFDTELRTMERQQAWFAGHGPKHSVLVAELDGAVVGWASLSQWSDRPAYDGSAETSFYVYEAHHGHGIGRQLLVALLDAAKQAGLHTLLARITSESEASLHLHYGYGFTDVGVMREVGYKFGRYLDVHMLQKML